MFDMPRITLEALSIFDWLTPLFKMGQLIKNDPPLGLNSWAFFISNGKAIHKGWSKDHIKQLLKQNNIQVYSDIVTFGEIILNVPISQAAQAEIILNRYGIPIHPRSQGAPKSKAILGPQPSYFDTVFRSSPEPLRCEYCRSFDIRKGKCHNCGAMT